MTLDELEKLIKARIETDQLEFKSTTAELQKACRTLCAFLNHQGGLVLIGIKERKKGDYQFVGQMVTDSTRLEIANELEKFEPPVRV